MSNREMYPLMERHGLTGVRDIVCACHGWRVPCENWRTCEAVWLGYFLAVRREAEHE